MLALCWASLRSRPSLNSEPWLTVMDLGLPVDRICLRMCLFAVCAVRSLDGKALILLVAPLTMMWTLVKSLVGQVLAIFAQMAPSPNAIIIFLRIVSNIIAE